MTKTTAVIGVVAALSLSGCLPYMQGSIYSQSQIPMQATDNERGPNEGEACMHNILGVVAYGDASINAAAKDANVTDVATVDTYFSTILGIYSTSCTQVTGQ